MLSSIASTSSGLLCMNRIEQRAKDPRKKAAVLCLGLVAMQVHEAVLGCIYERPVQHCVWARHRTC
eukprot:5566392-Amphidinium_carterae.1